MPLADRCPTLGTPARWSDELWPDFEREVLQALGVAWMRLRRGGINLRWSENRIAAELLDPLDDVLRERDLPIFPQDETRLLRARAAEVKHTGKPAKRTNLDAGYDGNPDRAPRIDLAIRHHGMMRAVYFGVEAKVLTEATVGRRTLGESTRAYVEDGVCRYTCGRYSSGMPAAAMLGFVLVGSGDVVLQAIEGLLRNVGIEMAPAENIRGIDRHHATDLKVGDSSLRLHHLLGLCAPPT